MPTITTIADKDLLMVITDPILGLVDQEVRLPVIPVGGDKRKVNTTHVGAFPPKQVIGDWSGVSH